jgi:hypothetical protein
MNDESNQPGGNGTGALKVLWLFCAFIPSAVAIASLKIQNAGPALIPVLALVNFACSFGAAAGLLSGSVTNKGAQSVLVFFLGVFFFGLNCAITVFVGCSRIAV